MANRVIRLPPFHYVHIFDHNKLTTKLVVGPSLVTLDEHEKALADPAAMIVVPPRHYCQIRNPVTLDEQKRPVLDEWENFALRLGASEYRLHGPPFPLYPGEELTQGVTLLTTVPPDCALKIRCVQDFVDDDGEAHIAGDQWLFKGPGTYYPRPEVVAASSLVESLIVLPDTALRLRARRDGIYHNVERVAGEVWLHTEPGAYLPDVEEIVEGTERAEIITNDSALHLRSLLSHTDRFGVERKAGSEWLVTSDLCNSYIPEVSERKIGMKPITVLNDMQFCIIVDPLDDNGAPRFGERLLKRGPARFFVRPGETLEGNTIRDVEVLGEGQALLLQALDFFVDESNPEDPRHRVPGDLWMIVGPGEYVPSVDVEICDRRNRIPLDVHEGIYVRDRSDGTVRAVMGPQSYMLKSNEELWEKPLPTVVEEHLARTAGAARDRTRVVTLRTPHNTATQVYNFKEHSLRVVFGPDLIALGPDEDFTVLSLSGGKPKRPHMIKDIALQLGPDFMTDYVVVETADHAKLELRLSYNWQFSFDRNDQHSGHRLFSVPDFVGDGCMYIASRVRASVAAVPFDEFHKNSNSIIRAAVFGADSNGEPYRFDSNGLVITNVDIKAVEPVDQKTREMLQASVQLAIDITTQSVQLEAQHAAAREEQAAKGELGIMRIRDQSDVEAEKNQLIALRGECLAAQRIGQAVAESFAKSEAGLIGSRSDLDSAEQRSLAAKSIWEANLAALKARNDAEQEYQSQLNLLNIAKARALAEVEAEKFEKIIAAIGPDTIADIARAGPEMQAKLLEGLGIQSTLITDGSSPINLFNTASGLVSTQAQ